MATTVPLQKIVKQLRRAVLVPGGGDLTDGQLLAHFIGQQDEAAFEALVRRHGPMVLGVCRRLLGNIHDADDAFQATFLVLVHKAASLKSCELVGNWLYGVAYNTAIAARAKTARRRFKERQVMIVPETAVTPPDDWSELLPILDQELSRLADVYREAIVLCDLEGKTRKQAAHQLGIPESTMSGRLTTGRRQLARRLARHGLTLSSGVVATVLCQGAVSACVPTPLLVSTVKAATTVAAGSAAAGVVSASVAALTQGVLKTMFMAKVKTLTAVVLAFFLATGACLVGPSLAQPGLPAQDKQEKKDPSVTVPKDDQDKKQEEKSAGAPTSDEAKRIDALVKQLASSRYIEREDAQREIEKIGAPALKILHEAVNKEDKEISRRAGEMIVRLEGKLKTDKLIAPKMVKLSFKDVSVVEAVAELKKQSGYDVKLEGDLEMLGKRKLSLETGEVSYFEALAKLCAAANLSEKSQRTTNPQVILKDGKQPEWPTVYAGALRIRLLPADAMPNVKVGAGETPLIFEVCAEPRLRVAGIQDAPTITKAKDDQGRNISFVEHEKEATPVVINAGGGSGSARVIALKIKNDGKDIKSLKELVGSMQVQLQLASKPIAGIDNVLQASGKSAKGGDGTTLTLESIAKLANNSYKFVYSISGRNANIVNGKQLGGGPDADGKKKSSVPTLVDGNCNAYSYDPVPSTSMNFINGVMPITVTAIYRADAGQGEPSQLLLSAPKFAGVSVPFSFNQVPLK